MHPQFFEALTTCAAAGLMALYVASRPERRRIHRLILGLMLAMILWTGGVAVSHVATGPRLAAAACLATFTGIVAVPPLWLLLAAFTSRTRWILDSPRLIAALAAPSALAWLALVTNRSHYLMVRDPGALIESTAREWAGPLYWVWAVWGYALVAAGVALYLTRSVRLLSRHERTKGALLAASAIVPMAASVIHHLDATPSGYDRTPLFMAFSVALLFLSDWRFRLLGTVPVARRDVIEQLADGVIVVDAAGRILDMNPAAETMTRALLREWRGRHIADSVCEWTVGRAEIDAAQMRGAIDGLLGEGGHFSTRVEDHAERVFEIRGATVRGASTELAGLYLTLRDVTKQTQLESLMRQSQRLETVAGLAAGIAHEVNNPLAYVRSNLSYVHSLTQELAVDSDRKEEFDELRLVVEEGIEGVDRIRGIIDRVRRFSRIGTEELLQVSVNEVVHDALRLARLGRYESVEVDLSLAEELPTVEACLEGLTQVVTNLITNAAQAVAPQGGSIRISTHSVGDQVEIRVEDDGPGVPAEVRPRIFDPFFTTKKPGEGTGLGLAVAFRIVREYGGALLYDPPEEGGAAFLVRLPGAPEATPEPAPPGR